MNRIEDPPKSFLRSTDTLANERTFLAYVRTALAFIAFGFVIARFALFEREISVVANISFPGKQTSATFGVLMAVVGVVVGLYGSIRYSITDRALRKGMVSEMPPWAALLGGIIIAAIGIAVAVNLLRF